ncbi:MAG: DNA repair protein RecN [Bacilli bacterium]|nr:DNA repair protein RecN [Bacillales bacterium]MDY2574508.1 DNA repair protein RecN [Bacilli bacterium]
MLKNLTIKNFAIIQDININFEKGMNILLGETGAGKSIIIDALGLLLGNRSDYDKIRYGEKKAIIEGTFTIENQNIKEYINEKYELIEDDNILVVSRTLEEGKSYCKINFHNVPQSVLKDVMENIIDIHSQHKDNSFFDEKKQIDYIDLYLEKNKNLVNENFLNLKKEYNSQYKKLNEEKSKLNVLKQKKLSLDDVSYLEYQIQEIEKLNLKENEIEEIDEELLKLNSLAKIYSNYQNFKENYQNASSYLYQAKKDLGSIHEDFLSEQISRFDSLYYDLEDCFETIKSEISTIEDSQDRLEYLQNRKQELSLVKRKYGKSTKEILDQYHQMLEDLNTIKNIGELIVNQEKEIEKEEKICIDLAKQISEKRNMAIELLEKEMNDTFTNLALNNALFKVNIEECPLYKNGQDKISFLLRANVGSKFLPLSQCASLGETSRINLAYKLVFNALDPVGTIIFDEIDTGISSNVGVLVSKRIKELSKISQTIVITHLPQMAAVGDYCLFVSKNSNDNQTSTNVKELSKEELIYEIARMISGENVNNISLEGAKNLIEEMK